MRRWTLSICQWSHGVTLCQVLVVQFQGGFVLFHLWAGGGRNSCPAFIKSWVSFSTPHVLGTIEPASNPSTWEAESGVSKVQGHPQLQVGAQRGSWIFPLCFNSFSNLYSSLGDFGVCSLIALYTLSFCSLHFHDFLKWILFFPLEVCKDSEMGKWISILNRTVLLPQNSRFTWRIMTMTWFVN